MVYRVVWYAEDDCANIKALQARVNELQPPAFVRGHAADLSLMSNNFQ